ncbi:HEAT repeat domain-containing protein [Marinitoga hydrogenitolerans]|nr:HEAT repeat domain-containing protein [Marinitoga hydrogenitolerans]
MDLKKMLFSSDKYQILKALEIILRDNKNEYAKELFKLLKYENEILIQESIIYTLKHLNLDNISDDLFFEFLKEENLLLKEFVLSILSTSKKVKVLGKLLESEDKDFRKYALDGLYRTNTKEAIPLIAKCLDDPDINNQIAAVEYLGLLGAEDYAEKIAKKLSNTKNLFLISTILETLSIIGNENTDKIIEEKLKTISNPYLYLPYAKYIFKRKNIFKGIEFFKNSEKKELILKEFLEFISKNSRNIYLYTKLRKEIASILSALLKENIPNEYKYDILMILDNLLEDEIIEVIKENIKHLEGAGLIAAIEIINEKKLISLKKEILNMNLPEEMKYLIEETFEDWEMEE